MVLCGLPEAWKVYKTGNSGSTYGLIVLATIGEIFGTIYAIQLNDPALLLNYGINTITLSYILQGKLRYDYRKK